jgi:hypothetical protein
MHRRKILHATATTAMGLAMPVSRAFAQDAGPRDANTQ